MTIWEAHRALSNSIGDPCNITSTQIPDGVRYSKALRDSYLYRAMLHIYQQALAMTVSMPRTVAVRILQRIFPNMTTPFSVTCTSSIFGNGIRWSAPLGLLLPDGTPRKLLCLYELIGTISNNRNVPIPIKNDSITSASLLNSRNIQLSDAFAVYNVINNLPMIDIYDMHQEITTSTFSCDALLYPVDPSLYITNFLMPLDIEETQIQQVLSLAALYAYADGQDIESISTYLSPSLQNPLIQGLGNANNQ